MTFFKREGHSKMNRIGILVSTLVLIGFVILYIINPLLLLENKFQDSVYQEAGITALDIYVVGIDEATLQDRDTTVKEDGSIDYGEGGLGQFQTWTRTDIANIINVLNADPENKPAVIGLDILFSGHKTDKEDQDLVKAVKNGQNVVLGCQATFGTKLSDDNTSLVNTVKTYEEPFEELRRFVDIGHINTVPDEDGVIRHSIYQIPVGEKIIPSFSYAILNKYNKYWEVEEEIEQPPLNNSKQFYITYSGETGDYYGSSSDGTSVIRVLNGEIDPAMFAGSIVLIGPYSFGMMDSYYTPLSANEENANEQMHGVEIHANIIQALMEENYKKQTNDWIEIAIMVVVGIMCIFISGKLDMRISAPLMIILIIGYIFVAKYVFGKGYILTLIYPVLCMVILYITQVAINYIAERKEKQRIKGIFKKYVDPKLVDKLIISGEADSNEVGKTKDIAVLFVDVRGFTPMSEKLKEQPETIVKILNEYLELTSNAVFNNGGSVDKFIGDATMALFNGFVPLDDYEYKAVCTAWDIVKGAQHLNDEIQAKYGVDVGFGVGVNCGSAVVGNLGPSFRKDFTAIGDTVNTSARLESNAKAGTVLIGPEVYERLKDRISVVEIGEISLKGKSVGLMIYELTDIKSKA